MVHGVREGDQLVPASVGEDARGDERLDHSRPIRWDRALTDPEGKPLFDLLEAQLHELEQRKRARKGIDRQRFRATLEAFVLDLLVEAWSDPSRWLAYSRGRGDYQGQTRYRNPLVTYQAVCKVADLLVTAGYAEGKTGFYDRSHYEGMAPVGRRSRIRATDRLLDLASSQGLTRKGVGIAAASETILLRAPKLVHGKPGELIEYDDTAETRKMRDTLGRINALLATARITVPGPVVEEEQDLPSDEDDDEPLPTDRTTHRLHRVFNDASFDRGGRFYGWWQGLRKTERPFLLINDEPVIELDFSGMHPRLCYALSGQPLDPDVDPYAIPGFETQDLRELVKRGFGQLLNGTDKTWKAPPGCKERLPKGMRWGQLLAAIEAKHRPIAGWLRCKRGLELQAVDAAIAEVILSYLHHRGIICLPVHDSFIVARQHERVLGETMLLAWHRQLQRFGGNAGVPRIKGWSSKAMENELTQRVVGWTQ
jgi:hypothetical protein